MQREQKRNEKLLKAAEEGDLEKVKKLVRHGADINYKDTFGSFTALHCAANNGNIEIINYLADNEADMNCRNNRGRTPLHLSVYKGQIEASKALINRGTAINAVNIFGCTALHMAGYWVQSVEMSKMLVDNGASVNIKDKDGITPVEIAAKGHNTDVFEYLKVRIEYDLERFGMKTEDDFQNIVSQGSYQSHENRIYLVGPYNVGKTTIAAVLVNDEIPRERCPTNGIWLHLRRAGMNIEEREWVFFKSEIAKSSSVLEGFLMSVNYSGIAPDTTTIYERSGRTANKYATDCEIVYEPEQKKRRLATYEQDVRLESSQVSDKRHVPYNMIGATHSQMYNRIKEMLQNGKYEEKIAPVDIWDFGGQDVYYVTHQLFICYRGTFILVFDGSKQMNDRLDVKSYLPGVSEYPTTSVYLLHWVNSILTYCKNTKDGYPKILFVATHKDLLHKHSVENRRREITRSLEILFENHSGRHHLIFNPLIFVNATDKSDREMRMVKDQIVSIAFSHPKWGEQMPVAWITLELQIALRVEKDEFVLTKDALIAINTHETSVPLNEQALQTFLKIQNSLGKIIYFNVKKLNNYIIINPLCLIQVLKSIVTIREHWPSGPDFSRTLLELSCKGIISKENIFQIWQQPEFSNLLPYKDFMIEILCHLDILVEQKRYDIDTDDQVIERYLVPSMITTPCDLWQCSEHTTSTDLKQMTIWFAKERTEDIYTCRHGQVLKDADLQKRPTNKQLAQLSRRLSKDSCKELAIHLKVSEDTIQSIWDEYKHHVDDYKFMLLWKWKVNNRHTSLQDLLTAIRCIDEDDHKMCQVKFLIRD
ncbi:Hypothetical predicted protein [Mytilus galloprovincialis]|uniref:Death domain-containing protein n=1 Tax=Mytilus galloprovincialis TaxID=29158 RepID=A0A8B6GN69_MYTGA|nr:Hypothetical predicted protein [Mytilus galloprovincialis]